MYNIKQLLKKFQNHVLNNSVEPFVISSQDCSDCNEASLKILQQIFDRMIQMHREQKDKSLSEAKLADLFHQASQKILAQARMKDFRNIAVLSISIAAVAVVLNPAFILGIAFSFPPVLLVMVIILSVIGLMVSITMAAQNYAYHADTINTIIKGCEDELKLDSEASENTLLQAVPNKITYSSPLNNTTTPSVVFAADPPVPQVMK